MLRIISWPTLTFAIVVLASLHSGQLSFRPTLTLANPHYDKRSFGRPILTLVNPHYGQLAVWPTLTLIGQPSFWSALTLANPHLAQASFWLTLTLGNPHSGRSDQKGASGGCG